MSLQIETYIMSTNFTDYGQDSEFMKNTGDAVLHLTGNPDIDAMGKLPDIDLMADEYTISREPGSIIFAITAFFVLLTFGIILILCMDSRFRQRCFRFFPAWCMCWYIEDDVSKPVSSASTPGYMDLIGPSIYVRELLERENYGQNPEEMQTPQSLAALYFESTQQDLRVNTNLAVSSISIRSEDAEIMLAT